MNTYTRHTPYSPENGTPMNISVTKGSQAMSLTMAIALVVIGLVFVGFIDFISGVEIRTYPLYFLPLSLAAWRLGKLAAALAVIAATIIWVISNWAAGLRYSIDHT